MKDQHAKRLSHEPLPNIFKLFREGSARAQPAWRLQRGLLARADLVPNIEQDAGRESPSLILNVFLLLLLAKVSAKKLK